MPGDLIIEIMPRETSTDGKQIQLPKAAATSFFGLPDRVGASASFRLVYSPSGAGRDLTMTVFGNHTVRLSISELEYRHRPCLIRFHQEKKNLFFFEIIQRSIFPKHFRSLLLGCDRQSRQGSRRWGMVKK